MTDRDDRPDPGRGDRGQAGPRPTSVPCEVCGQPVRVRPSGRMPRRHPGRCPPVRPDTAPAPPPEPDAAAAVVRRLSPLRWEHADGSIRSADGTVLGWVTAQRARGPFAGRDAPRRPPDVPRPSERGGEVR